VSRCILVMSILSSIEKLGDAKGGSICVQLVNIGYLKYMLDIPLQLSTLFIQVCVCAFFGLFYWVPDHGSCHRKSQHMQAFCTLKLTCMISGFHCSGNEIRAL